MYNDDSSYGKSAATEDGLMEYTPSVAAPGQRSTGLTPAGYHNRRDTAGFYEQDTIHEAAQAMDDILDAQYEQL